MSQKACCAHHYHLVNMYFQDVSTRPLEQMDAATKQQLVATHIHLSKCKSCDKGYQYLRLVNVFQGAITNAILNGKLITHNMDGLDELTREEIRSSTQDLESFIARISDHNS